MKSILNFRTNCQTVLLLIVIGFFAGGCKKNILDEIAPGADQPLAISASVNGIVLHENEYGNDAVELKWTAGSNGGTNSAISYVLYIDKSGNNFTNAVEVEMGYAAFSKKYTVKELNELLVGGLHLAPGTESAVDVKLVSTVAVNSATESALTTIKVTPYQPVSAELFLFGDAAPGGLDAENATAMVNNGVPGKFTWQGKLNVGTFKFLTKKGQLLPSYVRGTLETELVLRSLEAQPDTKFDIQKTGLYNVVVDLLNLSVSIIEGSEPLYKELWIVGDATPNGWNIDNPSQMRLDRSNPFVFTYSGVLNAGEFKFPTSKGNWGGDFYMPLVNYQDLTLADVQLVSGGNPDNKWKIINAGNYKVKLDILTNKIEIKPFTPFTKIWLVGDATPNGWDINNATPMLAEPGNPDIFTYVGAMKAGEFKFALQMDFNGDFFMSVTEGEGAESTEMKFVPGGNPDVKWKLTQPGNYRITIDQSKDTIKIEKL